jgi:HD superfamily phosphohydrolase
MPSYGTLDYVDVVKDPIWTEVHLTQLECDIVHTKAFARLRHIRQMGFAYLAFPGANHTRYEHSVGAMKVAYQLLQMLGDIPAGMDRALAARMLRASVLLHDIGHPPFSHVVEETFRKYPHLIEFEDNKSKDIRQLRRILGDRKEYTHENFTRFVIETDAEICGLITDQGLDINQVKMLSVGKAAASGLVPLNSLIDGDFDADKIDYILRDSYYCGLSNKVDLNEFRGKFVIEKLEGEPPFKLFVLPEGVSAIDSLLLARYRLIDEVHGNEVNRIATQMLIEKIRLWLEDLSPVVRARTVLEMHTKMTDYDLISILGQFAKGPDIHSILDGELYRETLAFTFAKMHPSIRASLHLIINNPTSIASIQEKLRDDFQDKDLIVDIKEPKPPKFTTLVRFEESRHGKTIPAPRNIFDRYYTAHGILIDSFNNLAVYIYGSRPERPTVSPDKMRDAEKDTETVSHSYFKYLEPEHSIVARRIIESARQIRAQKAKEGVMVDIDFLMTVLCAIEDYGRKMLSRRELWVYSDSALQSYLQKVVEFCVKSHLLIVSEFIWDNEQFSTKVFRDLERLINMGLVDHIHKRVPHPANWGSRVDRCISGWGKGYAAAEIRDLHPYPVVYRYVQRDLKKVGNDLQRILELEDKCTAYDDAESVSKREPLNDEIDNIRKKLRAAREIILTNG